MNFQTCGFDRLAEYESNEFARVVSTAILSVTYRISSELRSQATAGLVSTTVGDHVGIRGAVGSLFLCVAGSGGPSVVGRSFGSAQAPICAL